MSFTLETDHKPLVPLLSTTDLDKMPPRVLRFRLRMMRFSAVVIHVQGKDQTTADALSRAPVGKATPAEELLIGEVDEFTSLTIKYLPATAVWLHQIMEAQDQDAICCEVKTYVSQQPLIRPYWEKRHHLTIHNGLLMYNDRIVMPQLSNSRHSTNYIKVIWASPSVDLGL